MGHHRSGLSRLVTVLASVCMLVFLLVGVVGADADTNGEPATAEATGNAPDVQAMEEAASAGVVAAAEEPLNFMFVSASGFTPYDDDMTFTYSGAGCVYRTGGTNLSEYAVQLPQGAIVDYLRIYYYDNDATNNVSAYLFSFDGSGNSIQIASAASSGQSTYYGNAGSGFFAFPVDNIDGSLELRLNYGGGTTSALKICGVRIRYQYSALWASFLPSVQR